MKKTLTILCLLLSTTFCIFGQTKPKTEPFIIQGQISNCPENILIMHYDDYADGATDTLRLDPSGNFYLKTFKVKKPQIIKLQGIKFSVRELYIAPGYNLTFKANGKDSYSLNTTKKITGIGSESNKYRIVMDSINEARWSISDGKNPVNNDFLKSINKDQKFNDSIVHTIFDRKPIQDKYLQFMGTLTRLDLKLTRFESIILYTLSSKYDYRQSIDFVRANFDNDILDHLYRDEYLTSFEYKRFICFGYPYFLISHDQKKDSTIHQDLQTTLNKINKVYTGKVKDYALNYLMYDAIEGARSFEQINSLKDIVRPLISNLKDPHYKKNLTTMFSDKVANIMMTQVGKPAPAFVLESNLGKTYSLKDFKGKVVYLDLWASWCHPCRGETPAFKILYDKYKNNNQVAFISIAVKDAFQDWIIALAEDKPEWIQLIDKDEFVNKSYVAYSIPKFILIDKKGNIVNFDAPRPSSGVEIEKLLNQEIAK